MGSIIGRITIQPPQIRPAEPAYVEVYDNDDNLIDCGEVSLLINGVVGNGQYLQFPTEGQRRITVSARTGAGEMDFEEALLDVAGEPLEFQSTSGQSDIAMIGVTQVYARPYTAILTLGSTLDARTPTELHLRSHSSSPFFTRVSQAAKVASAIPKRGALAQVLAGNSGALVRSETRRMTKERFLITPATQDAPPSPRRYAIANIYDLGDLDVGSIIGSYEGPKLEFHWDFGDGQTQTTSSPTVAHDYFAAMDHGAATSQFTVACTVKSLGLTVKRTLTIASAYHQCSKLGVVVPHIEADLFANKRFNMLTASFTIHNVEEEPLLLDRLSVSAHSENPNDLSLPRPFVKLGAPISIPARSSSMIGVNVPFVTSAPKNGEVPYNAKGFTVIYGGKVGDKQVRCTAVFDVPVAEWNKKPRFDPGDIPPIYRKPWPWELVENVIDEIINPLEDPGDMIIDSKTGTMAVVLGSINSERLKSDQRARGLSVLGAAYAPIEEMRFDARRLAAPVAELMSRKGKRSPVRTNLRKLSPKLATRTHAEALQFLSGPPIPGAVAEGEICDPDNLSEEELAFADMGQLVCQVTTEVQDVLMPARWMNARKGDCILSPGGDGLIGGLMLNVQPPQWYSHSGIMTRNYDEITHSTGSAKRLKDHLVGAFDGSDGFEPSILKWIWPGAVTQTIQRSIEGEDFPDPEYNKTYSISAFGAHTVGVTHNDQMKMIPPLVLKPDPMQETPAVRIALHAIATDARNDAGRPGVKPKYHYRWYCYTDPTIGQGAPEGAEAGWAEGTHASVCSSYIWMHAKARGAHLETSSVVVNPTDLEPDDVTAGAAVRPTTPDGLYNYSKKERSDAAWWLYNEIYNEAYKSAGWFGNILTDAADDVANQFLNAFANDDADGKDSDAWQNLMDADAVSPDNMMWWDSPARGGLFGFVEPALYREPRVESYTISRWKKVLTRGTLRGKVLKDGAGVPSAFVQVYDGKTTFSGADGTYQLDDVPFGAYQLKGSKVIDGVLHSAQVSVDLQEADKTVDLPLNAPPDRYRIAQVFIDFYGVDDENWPWDDEILDPGPEYFELELGPDKASNSSHKTYKWGGELRVEYDITVRLLVNNTIDVQVQGTLYEGTSEDTKDLDGTGGLTFQVGLDQTQAATLTITNTDEDSPDSGVLAISVKNVRNTN